MSSSEDCNKTVAKSVVNELVNHGSCNTSKIFLKPKMVFVTLIMLLSQAQYMVKKLLKQSILLNILWFVQSNVI